MPTEFQRPPQLYLNGPAPLLRPPGQDPHGFIMVDPLQTMNQTLPSSSKKNKRNKKKKNKNAESSNVESESNPKIVTLRNPLFHATGNDHMSNMIPPPQSQLPLNINQAASIIKNENGMFTIRNTALHQALTNGVGPNFRQYSSDIYGAADPPKSTYSHIQGQQNQQQQQQQQKQQHQQPPDNFSYFSDGINRSHQKSPIASIGASTTNSGQPCTMAIGSEIKNAQQLKSMPWNGTVISKATTASTNGDLFNQMPHLHPQQTRSYSPFDSMPNYSFNRDFVGISPTPHSQATTSNYYSNGSGYGNSNYNHVDSNSLFSQSATSKADMHCGHRCDESPPQLHDMNQYYKPSYFPKLDDLNHLQPGHRLNSEVCNQIESHGCQLIN